MFLLEQAFELTSVLALVLVQKVLHLLLNGHLPVVIAAQMLDRQL